MTLKQFLRGPAEMSWSEIAKVLDCSPAAVSLNVNGKREWFLWDLYRLALALNERGHDLTLGAVIDMAVEDMPENWRTKLSRKE